MVEGNVEYLELFRTEIRERLATLGRLLGSLDATRHRAIEIVPALREAHTIKSLAAVIGLDDARELAHGLEDLLVALRDGKTTLTPALIDLIGQILYWLEESAARTPRISLVREILDDVMLLLREPVSQPLPAASSGAGPSEGSISGKARELPTTDRRNRKEAKYPDVVQITPDEFEELEGMVQQLKGNAASGDLAVDRLSQLALLSMQQEVRLAKFVETAPDQNVARGAVEAARELRQGLDAEFIHWGELMRTSSIQAEELGEFLERLQYVPLISVLEPLPRVARDTAKKEQKEVEVVLSGSTARLRRQIVQQLRSPLIQLVRNAVSHGIEIPTVREAAGKNRVGRIEVFRTDEGENVRIEVCDDGAGIDVPQIRRIARERGIWARDADGWSDDEAIQFIFRSGFSTRAEASGTAGRGVGLDSLRTALSSMNGTVRIESEPGRGTRFILEIPRA